MYVFLYGKQNIWVTLKKIDNARKRSAQTLRWWAASQPNNLLLIVSQNCSFTDFYPLVRSYLRVERSAHPLIPIDLFASLPFFSLSLICSLVQYRATSTDGLRRVGEPQRGSAEASSRRRGGR
jgi:hypothetical protein